MERLTVKDEEFEQVYVTGEKIHKTWSADIYAHVFEGDAIEKLAEYEDLAEVFEKKITSEVFEILKDKEELAMWLDRVLWSVRKLDEYTRAEEQGLLLRLPCKVDDTYFVIDSPFWGEVDRETCKKCEHFANGNGWEMDFCCASDEDTDYISCLRIYEKKFKTVREIVHCVESSCFFKSAFLTREEAEASLEELRGNTNGC